VAAFNVPAILVLTLFGIAGGLCSQCLLPSGFNIRINSVLRTHHLFVHPIFAKSERIPGSMHFLSLLHMPKESQYFFFCHIPGVFELPSSWEVLGFDKVLCVGH
jgi:hypothetical protein